MFYTSTESHLKCHLQLTWNKPKFRWLSSEFFVFFQVIKLPRWLPHSNQGAHKPNTTAQSHMAGHTVSHGSLQWWLASSWPGPGVWPGHTVSHAIDSESAGPLVYLMHMCIFINHIKHIIYIMYKYDIVAIISYMYTYVKQMINHIIVFHGSFRACDAMRCDAMNIDCLHSYKKK